MKRQIASLLKRVDEARAEGLIVSLPDMVEAEAMWEKLWGCSGAHYPYMTLEKMIKDLREEIV